MTNTFLSIILFAFLIFMAERAFTQPNAKDVSKIDTGKKVVPERTPNAPKSGLWICFLKTDWKKKQLTWIPLCRNGSSWKSQDEHPHPIFNHASNAIFFTSDKDGKMAVYKVNHSFTDSL